ncbi:MAG: hypothetical protein HC848_06205 [Limnobacter sp.]|nr:hypothetical protein [Limnobacter sp.]
MKHCAVYLNSFDYIINEEQDLKEAFAKFRRRIPASSSAPGIDKKAQGPTTTPDEGIETPDSDSDDSMSSPEAPNYFQLQKAEKPQKVLLEEAQSILQENPFDSIEKNQVNPTPKFLLLCRNIACNQAEKLLKSINSCTRKLSKNQQEADAHTNLMNQLGIKKEELRKKWNFIPAKTLSLTFTKAMKLLILTSGVFYLQKMKLNPSRSLLCSRHHQIPPTPRIF